MMRKVTEVKLLTWAGSCLEHSQLVSVCLQIIQSISKLSLLARYSLIKVGGCGNLIVIIEMSRKVKDKKNYKMYNQTLYEVQRVVQVRWVKNKQYCLIKWRGYDEKFNTWEPKDHITFCYNYEAPEDKDDPEYFEKVPICTPTPHHYQTRTKNKPNEPAAKTTQVEEKQDPTQLEEHLVAPNNNYSLFPIEKSIKEVNKEMLQIRKKGDFQPLITPKEDLVCRVLDLIGDKKSDTRRGKVETQDGRIIYMSEDVLKSRYPEKVIEYYEQQLKSKSIRCD